MRWIGPAAVLVVAALARLWALDRPDALVFDELYYVRDAVSQLAHGYPTTWPDDDAAFGGERARAFSDAASNAVHPPLGKWVIGLGILLLGPDSGWGWRIAVAVAGVLTVAATMRLGWLLSRDLRVACIAGFVLAIDGVHVVLSRVGLLDGILSLAVVVGAICAWRDREGSIRAFAAAAASAQDPAWRTLWRRPWLVAAAAVFGAAAAVKWSGLYPLVCFLAFATVHDLILRRRLSRGGAGGDAEARSSRATPFLAGALQTPVTVAIALPVAAAAYVAGWAGWILTSGGHARQAAETWWEALAQYHADMFSWHSTLSAPHPFQSDPLTWPLGLLPTSMYRESMPSGDGCPWADGCVAVVSPLPNLIITWGGLAALLMLLVVVVRSAVVGLRGRGSPAPAGGLTPTAAPAVAAAFVLVGYLSGWLPWVLTFSRSAVFQFYAVVTTPFSAVALGLVMGALVRARSASSRGASMPSTGLPGLGAPLLRLDPSPQALRGRRIAMAIILVVAALVSLYFFPLWSAAPVPEWFWRSHLWLPDWL